MLGSLTVIVFLIHTPVLFVNCDCEVTLINDLQTPIWFSPSGIILLPSLDKKIKANTGSHYFLQCSYGELTKDVIKISFGGESFPEVEVQCIGNSWMINGNQVDPSTARCETKQVPSVWDSRSPRSGSDPWMNERSKCASYDPTLSRDYLWNGVGIYTHKFGQILLYESCLNIKTLTPMFNVHTYKSSGIITSSSPSPDFIRGNTQQFPGNNPNHDYEQNSQLKEFKKILGAEQTNKYIVKNQKYLAKGHLVPNGDFAWDILRKVTYFYTNALPQWQSLNNGPWKSLETQIRNQGKELKIITGGSDILRIYSSISLKDEDIYLNKPRLPVPYYIWKIISDRNGHTMGFYILNDPLVTRNNNPECKRYRWNNLSPLIYCFGPEELNSIPFHADIPNGFGSQPLLAN